MVNSPRACKVKCPLSQLPWLSCTSTLDTILPIISKSKQPGHALMSLKQMSGLSHLMQWSQLWAQLVHVSCYMTWWKKQLALVFTFPNQWLPLWSTQSPPLESLPILGTVRWRSGFQTSFGGMQQSWWAMETDGVGALVAILAPLHLFATSLRWAWTISSVARTLGMEGATVFGCRVMLLRAPTPGHLWKAGSA